jgi:imidazolonepropionase
MVMPGFCDSHPHVVYAGSREGEFIDKINGLSYEQIAARGGGILNSSDLLHETSEDELYRQSMQRVHEMMAKGSAAIEIKSGYGLNPADELKMLRVIRRIKENVPALIRSTFLGAHAVGRGYSHQEYVRAVIDMMPKAAELADFVDVFCDQGFFTTDDCARILAAGARHGLKPKIHANELAQSGGVQVGVKYGALSVDHLERSGEAEIEALKGSGTMPTMLPGSSFFLGIPYAKAKDYIQAGLGIALASDYNPGSSPMGDMRFVMALGCIKMRLSPAQAFNAVTLNSAYAMGVSHLTGSITPGKRADLIITQPGWNLDRLPYLFQTPFIKRVLTAGVSL